MNLETTKEQGSKTNKPVEARNILERSPYMITPTEISKAVNITQATISKAFANHDLPQITGRSYGVPPKIVRGFLEKRGHKFEQMVIAHVNMRGGIGKTTSTISAASRAAQYGYNVCIIDLDSQGSASQAFGIEPTDDDNLFIDIWNKDSSEITSSLKKIQDNLYILPSSLENGLLDSELSKPQNQKQAVRNVCNKLLKKNDLMKKGFDLIFIDCPPSLGSAIISTVCGADVVIVPVQSDAFSIKGLQLVTKEIKSVCETFNVDIPEIRILYTNYDGRKKQSVDTMQTLVKKYGEYLIPTFIRSSTDFDKANYKKETIFASPRASQAKEDYDMYLRYILGFGEEAKQ